GGMGVHPIEDYLQTDASLPDGFAGGPVVDVDGRLIGMSTALVVGSAAWLGPQTGIGIAVPLDWIDRGVAWVRAGLPPRPWIGAFVIPADVDSRQVFGLPPEVRWVTQIVFPGSPAAAAGLKRGDGILRVQGQDPAALAEVQERLLRAGIGETWSLEAARGRAALPLSLTLAARPGKAQVEGLDALQYYGGVEIALKGPGKLAATRVLPGSEAARAKVAPGDQLVSMLVKKDLEHAERDTARWRTVNEIEDVRRFVQGAYSDFDFFVGLHFRSRQGEDRRLFLREILTPTGAL
ncbi:MAG TPA: PDZ domain-containing protein, partial [Candidatus Polarisedimenticolia bacterium]|nr:PDZ domain-containing protein [Candidatus Polarisedimenticolia bacterium]